MEYKEIKHLSRNDAQYALQSENVEIIVDALLSIALHDSDWEWAQEVFIRFLKHENTDISAVSATCLGHLARIHGKLDKNKVIMALQSKISIIQDTGIYQDSIDDIEMYVQD